VRGVYYLLIYVRESFNIKIGSLGYISFKKGFYVYVGSGKGEGNSGELLSRVVRHLRLVKRLRWHVDYLLSSRHVELRGVCIIEDEDLTECELVKKILLKGSPVPGFGSTDCKNKCPSHLIRLYNSC
jgi:Uri superfamily endonuclease